MQGFPKHGGLRTVNGPAAHLERLDADVDFIEIKRPWLGNFLLANSV
jgi:hypothetical protein